MKTNINSDLDLDLIEAKVLQGKRLTKEDGLTLFASNDLAFDEYLLGAVRFLRIRLQGNGQPRLRHDNG